MCNNGLCVSISGVLFGCFCVGTRVPWHAYGSQTAYRNWFPPSTMWILGICLCSSAFTYRIIFLGLCLFWGVQLCVCKHLGVKGKLGVHSFHHVGSRNGMTIRFSHALLFSTPLLPLHCVWVFLVLVLVFFGGRVWDSLCHPNWPLTEQSLYLGLPSTEIRICEPPCL